VRARWVLPHHVDQPRLDARWAKIHATNSEIKRVTFAATIRPYLLIGELGPASQRGGQLVELTRKDFLKHVGVLIYNDYEYTVENILRAAVCSGRRGLLQSCLGPLRPPPGVHPRTANRCHPTADDTRYGRDGVMNTF
jgi:hypothetical protein